jgi:hypothetical protein
MENKEDSESKDLNNYNPFSHRMILPIVGMINDNIILANDFLSMISQFINSRLHNFPSQKEIIQLLTDENKEIAEAHFKMFTEDVKPNHHILLAIIKLWKDNKKLPSKDELTMSIFNYRCQCGILDDTIRSEDQYIGLIEHCIYQLGYIPNCNRMINLIQYKQIQHRYPNIQELTEYEHELQ